MNFIDMILKDPEWVELLGKCGFEKVETTEQKATQKAGRQTARVMLENGEPYETIAKYSFIPIDEIAEIDRELKAAVNA